MAEILGSATDLQLTIPSPGETNWAADIRDQAFQKIVDHDHSGSGGTGKAIAFSNLDTSLGHVANSVYITSRNVAGTANINMIRVGALNALQLGAAFESNHALTWRNAGNDTDLDVIKMDGSNEIIFGQEVSTLNLKHNTFITGRNAANTANKDMIKINTTDDVEIGDGIQEVLLAGGTGLITIDCTDIILGAATGASNIVCPGFGSLRLANGTTAQRPANAAGLLRYNTDNNTVEYFDNTTWKAIGNNDLSNLSATTAANVNLLPATAGSSSLGSQAVNWDEVHGESFHLSNGAASTFAVLDYVTDVTLDININSADFIIKTQDDAVADTSSSSSLEFLTGNRSNGTAGKSGRINLQTGVNDNIEPTGDIKLRCGQNTNAGAATGGAINITAGAVSGISATAGAIYVAAGSSATNAGTGGLASFAGGDATGLGTGGACIVKAGSSTHGSSTNDGGNLTLEAGDATLGTPGVIVMRNGASTTNTSGDVWTATDTSGSGNWAPGASAKASKALDDLVSVQINTDLLFDAALTHDIGSSSFPVDVIYTGQTRFNSLASVPKGRVQAEAVLQTGPSAILPDFQVRTEEGNLDMSVMTANETTNSSGQLLLETGDSSSTDVGEGSGKISIFSGLKTGVTGSGASGIIHLKSGDNSSTTAGAQSGGIIIESGDTVGINTTGSLLIQSGNAVSTGNSGGVQLKVGTAVGGTRGKIRFVDGTEGITGEVWTSTDVNGNGEWAAVAGGGPGSDTTAIHDDTASEISAITAKGTPVAGDFLIIEDSAAANVKKSITMGDIDHDALTNFVSNEHIDWTTSSGTIHTGNYNDVTVTGATVHTDNYIEGGAGTDTTAIHDNTASEISAIAVKGTPVGGDFLLIEDSAAANVKKHILISSLPSSGADAQLSNLSGTTAVPVDLKPTSAAINLGGSASADNWGDVHSETLQIYRPGSTVRGTLSGGVSDFTILGGTNSELIIDSPGSAVLKLDPDTGALQFVNSDEGTTGHVWTSTDAFGRGHWAVAAGGGDAWSDVVDANIIPDALGTRDIGTTALPMNKIFTEALQINRDADTGARLTISADVTEVLMQTPTSVDFRIDAQGTGEIILDPDTGDLQFINSAEGTVGHVWTSTDAFGRGHWEAAGGGGDAWGDPVDTTIKTADNATNDAVKTVDVTIETGDKSGTTNTAYTGDLNLYTGDNASSGTAGTGAINIKTGDCTNAGNDDFTGDITISSGNNSTTGGADGSGNVILKTGTTGSTNGDPGYVEVNGIRYYKATFTSTNSATSTLFERTMDADTSFICEMTLVGKKTDGTASNFYTETTSFRVDTSMSELGTPVTYVHEDMAAGAYFLETTGTANLRVRVTGVSATTIDWHVVLRLTLV